MITHFLELIKYYFGITPWIIIPLLFLVSITFMTFILFCLLLFLDISYRPNVLQYPFNIIFDRIMPLIIILSPTFLILNLKSIDATLLQKFSYILLIHLFIVLPLVYFWSKHRSWYTSTQINIEHYVLWNQPIFYLTLNIAIIYPAVWCVYFSMRRYVSLGEEIVIRTIDLSLYVDFIIIVILFMPYEIITVLLLLKQLNKIRNWFWLHYVNIIEVTHLFLLRYYIYFYGVEKMRKLAFILGRYISLANDVYPKTRQYSKFRYMLRFFYMKPRILLLIPLIFIVIELFFMGNIKYSLYLVFSAPLVYGFIYFIYILYTMDFVQDVCKADYYARNWKHPRYPVIFWSTFENDDSRHGFTWNFTDQELQEINVLAKVHLEKKFPTLFKFPKRVERYSFCHRLKASYKTCYGVRWVHTFARPIHSATGYFLPGIVERLALININWRPHYQIILNAEKMRPSIPIIVPWYKNFSNCESNHIRKILEHNFITNFHSLIKKKCCNQ